MSQAALDRAREAAGSAPIDKLSDALGKDHPEALESRRVNRTMSVLRQAAVTNAAAAARVSGVVHRLRSFARLDEATLQDVPISTCIEDVLAMVEHRRPPDVAIETELVHASVVRCYPAELNQLLLNVLENALDAVGTRGRIAVCSDEVGDELVLTVRDDGVGIAAEHLDAVFDPGFTTKGVGLGGGLGLAIAFRVAELHDGAIAIDSKQGKGTTVTLRIPIRGR